ncbi:uncharacterized protein LOC110880519 [Helianthus annuus]|uniref:uncharacterized protein LOC110880519 n=1 Tax=Helianthus annuus TaxID=4232 RepID=UPI000B8F0F25|nr:uncharacterized protein LOC110880519 [Helianthus annuus]
MGRAKAVGPDNIPIEVWKCLGEEGVHWLTILFNLIFKSGKMPDQWRNSVVVPVYKNKGDAQCCGNYRGIKLLGHTMKLWERIIETRIQRETQVTGALPWCLLFADDIVLVADSKQSLNARLEEWRAALEGRGLKISRSKTEYLYCDFSGVDNDEDIQITIDSQAVPQVTKFKYLGSFFQRDGEIDSDVAHRIQVGWCRWRAATGEVQARKMEVAEMRMLRWMCGHTRLDRIRNDVFREMLEVVSISDKIKEGRLRWFGHVKRRQAIEPVRVVETLEVEGRRSRGRPKITLDERIRQDLQKLHLSKNMVHDRSSWRRRIKVKDF